MSKYQGKPKPLFAPPEVLRKCTCGVEFLSTGDRYCEKCNERNKKVGKRIGGSGSGRDRKKLLEE